MKSHFRVGTKTTSVLETAYAFHTKTRLLVSPGVGFMVQRCSHVLFHVFSSSRVETTKSKGHLTMVVKNFLYTGVCPIQKEVQILVHSHFDLVS